MVGPTRSKYFLSCLPSWIVFSWLLLFLLGSPALAELPGGPVTVRPAMITKKGAIPRVVVQTVADSEVTATSLVIRYREDSKVGPSPGAAHLLEHLHFRSQSRGRPGELLIRNELLGGESRAWVKPNVIQFSELVPATEGLNSLQIQLERLRGVPKDKQDLAIERNTVLWESKNAASSPIERARRDILTALGSSPHVEGRTEELHRLQTQDLEELLRGLNPEEDVVISVVGPHSARQVRQFLSRHLAPILPARTKARESSKQTAVREKIVKVNSPGGLSQTSYFLSKPRTNRNTILVAKALLDFAKAKKFLAQLTRESQTVYRLDVSSPDGKQPQFPSLDKKAQKEFLQQLRRDWFERWESPQTRAEILAEATLFEESVEGPITALELPKFLGQATTFLRELSKSKVRLEVRGLKSRAKGRLFEFKQRANYEGPPGVQRQKLPNGLKVSWLGRSSWPIVAVSGFSKLRVPLNNQQALQLEKLLARRSQMGLEYEVKDGGLFFHSWTERENLEQHLKDCASEIKDLAKTSAFSFPSEAPKSGVLEGFFNSNSSIKFRSSIKGRELIDPKDTQLILVGDIDAIKLDRGVRPAWSGWFQKSLAKKYATQGPDSGGSRQARSIVERPAGSQAVLVLGFEGPSRSSPNFLAFNLAIQTLAGRPTTSLLARQLRDEQQLVQSIKLFPVGQAYLPSKNGDSRQPWLIALRLSESNRDPEKLASLVKARLERLAKEPLRRADIDRTRTYLKSRLKISASTIRGQARVMAHSEFYRLAESYGNDYAGLYDRLSPQQVKDTCKTYFSEAKLRWIYFKPKSTS